MESTERKITRLIRESGLISLLSADELNRVSETANKIFGDSLTVKMEDLDWEKAGRLSFKMKEVLVRLGVHRDIAKIKDISTFDLLSFDGIGPKKLGIFIEMLSEFNIKLKNL